MDQNFEKMDGIVNKDYYKTMSPTPPLITSTLISNNTNLTLINNNPNYNDTNNNAVSTNDPFNTIIIYG